MEFVHCRVCGKGATRSCAGCGAPLCENHATPDLPPITLGELGGALLKAARGGPQLLWAVLFEEEDPRPYCPTCIELHRAVRRRERRKLRILLVALLILVLAGIVLVIF